MSAAAVFLLVHLAATPDGHASHRRYSSLEQWINHQQKEYNKEYE